jgi:hypothetical protein
MGEILDKGGTYGVSLRDNIKEPKMKKLFVLLGVLFVLSSCSCLMSQVPPQYLYAGDECGAALPDYLPMLTIADNCGIKSVDQTPSPGSWLTVPTTTVLIRATDNFNNFTEMMFTVTLLDTVPPTIVVNDSSLISAAFDKMSTMYDAADRILAEQEMWFDNNFPWETVEVQYTDSLGVVQSIRGIPDYMIPSDLYCNRTLVTLTAPCHALTDDGGRVFIFASVGDTLVIQ